MKNEPISKEILEELGWKYRSGFYWELPWVTECNEISNRGLSWRLNYIAPDKALHIDYYERNSFEWERAYSGPCSTLDDILLLMTLLKLHQRSEYQDVGEPQWSDNIEPWERITEE